MYVLISRDNNDLDAEYHRRNYEAGEDDLLEEGNIREENIQEDIDYDDGIDNSEDEVEGEDLMENMEQDYRE